MNSRDKGKRGEREWARVLKETFGLTDARRGVQYAGSALSPDVVGSWPNTHPEVKRVERFDPQAWVEQAVRDAAGKIPYVAHRQNNKPWLITVRVEDFLELAKVVVNHDQKRKRLSRRWIGLMHNFDAGKYPDLIETQ